MTKKERRDSNPHSLVIVLSVVRLSLSNILFKKNDKELLFYTDYVGCMCVCCFIDLSNLASAVGRLAARCISFLSACANMGWRGSFDGTRKMR